MHTSATERWEIDGPREFRLTLGRTAAQLGRASTKRSETSEGCRAVG